MSTDTTDFEPGIMGFPKDEGEPPKSFWNITIREKSVKLLDVALFAAQAEALIGAGIPLNQVLEMLAESYEDDSPRLSKSLRQIRDDVAEGMGLGEAFSLHEAVFGELPVAMIEAAERTGEFESHFKDIAEDCEYRHATRSSMIAALIEPLLIVVAGIIVCYILMVVSVPQFKNLYEAMTKDGKLPLPTRILMQMSDFMTSPIGIALTIGLVAGVIGFLIAVKKSRPLRYQVHKLLLRMPVAGKMVRAEAIARGARTVAVCYKSIGDLKMGLEMAVRTTPNLRIAEAFSQVHEDVFHGSTIWEAMERTGEFPKLCVSMTKSGEESGDTDVLLKKLSETYEKFVKYRRERLVDLLRYGLLLIMGFFVLFIALSMYLPIFTLIGEMSRH